MMDHKDRIISKIKALVTYLTKKGFFHLLSVNLFSQLFSFVTLLIVAKLLSPTEYGDLKILQTYVNFIIVFATFGFSSSVLKLCSENREEDERAAILQIGLKRAGLSTAGTVIVAITLTSFGLITSSNFLAKWLIIYIAIVPIDVLTTLLSVYLQSRKKIKEMAIAQAIFRIQTVPLILFGTWRWGFAGFIISSIVSHLLGIWPFLRYVGIGFLKKSKINTPSLMMNYAIFSFLAHILSQITQNGDILILDHFSNERQDIGFYSLALLFILAATLITKTVKSIIIPYFSEHADDEKWFRTQLRKNQIRMAFFSIAVAIAVFIFGYIIVPIFYGQEYFPTINYLMILLIKFIITSSYSITSSAITGLGKINYTFIIALISAPIELILTYFSLRDYGFTGVAWSQVIIGAIVFILTTIFGKIAMTQRFGKRDQELAK